VRIRPGSLSGFGSSSGPGKTLRGRLGESDARVFPHNDADFQQKLGSRTLKELASLIIISMEGIVRPASILARVEGEIPERKDESSLVRPLCSRRVCKRIPYHIVGFLPLLFIGQILPQQKKRQQLFNSCPGQVEAGVSGVGTPWMKRAVLKHSQTPS